MEGMTIRFWGVRGSVATPGPATESVGGNTSAVEVRCGAERVVFDAGTGLRALGDAWMADGGDVRATLVLSHLHWDHIQGLPFFAPLYRPSTELSIVSSGEARGATRRALMTQMRAPTFPVDWSALPSRLRYRELRPGEDHGLGEARLRALRLPHPGGDVSAYRLDYRGVSVVYATDVERESGADDGLEELAEGADVLIHDAQYTPAEYRGEGGMPRRGWGHSTYESATRLARRAGVGRLILFHHDPTHDDARVAAIEGAARGLFAATDAAREGAELKLGAPVERRVA